MKRILFPSDFSKVAYNAFRYALGLAADLKADISFLHVQAPDVPKMDFVQPQVLKPVDGEQVENILGTFDRYLSMAQEDNPKPVKVSLRIETGLPAQEIIRLSSDFDLIVMGTKGIVSAVEKIFGSVAAEVLQKAKCPVLVVPDEAVYEGLDHLMYATALADEDVEVFPQLDAFMEQMNSKLSFVHVSTEVPVYSAVQQRFYTPTHEQVIGYYSFPHYDVIGGLAGFVHQNKVDMVVMLNRPRDLFDSLFEKSYSEEMALYTLVPLMVFHA